MLSCFGGDFEINEMNVIHAMSIAIAKAKTADDGARAAATILLRHQRDNVSRQVGGILSKRAAQAIISYALTLGIKI